VQSPKGWLREFSRRSIHQWRFKAERVRTACTGRRLDPCRPARPFPLQARRCEGRPRILENRRLYCLTKYQGGRPDDKPWLEVMQQSEAFFD